MNFRHVKLNRFSPIKISILKITVKNNAQNIKPMNGLSIGIIGLSKRLINLSDNRNGIKSNEINITYKVFNDDNMNFFLFFLPLTIS